MPGGASLYSLSVAWVSSCKAIVAWLCSVYCQATFKLPRIWLTKGSKGPFVILRAHSRV